MNELPYRPNVCMLVYNDAGLLFLGQRYREASVWQFPQGGVEPEGTLEENVLRELEEELGASRSNYELPKKLDATHEYDFLKPPAYAIGRWRGQTQTFWLVKFLGTDDAFKLDAGEQEFSDWKWCTPDEVRTLAEPRRVVGYEKPLKEFEAFLAGESTRRS